MHQTSKGMEVAESRRATEQSGRLGMILVERIFHVSDAPFAWLK